MEFKPLSELLEVPLRNGLTKPKKVRGQGTKMVNMGELFKHSRIDGVQMDRAPLTDKERSTSLLESGDLLFARQSLVREGAGKCSIFLDDSEPVFFESHLIRCRLNKEKTNPVFYYYYFNSLYGRNSIETIIEQGAGASGIRGSDLGNLQVPIYSLGFQNQVATVLDAFDRKISTNHKINQTLEKISQALFKSWFVDFEPVKAKMAALESGGTAKDAERAAMQAISGKSQAELDTLATQNSDQYDNLARTAALFPSAMVESEIGDIPEGWQVKFLSEMTHLIGGGTPKKSNPEYWGGDVLWFSVKDAPSEGNVFVLDTEEKITGRGLQESSAKILPIGTTIISARGTVGKLALTGRDMAMNQSCYGVQGADPIGPYLNYLNLHRAVDKLKRNVHGAVFDTITRDTFKTVSLVQAPELVMSEFESFVTPLFEKIKTNVLEVQTLAATRDTLLPKLLSGELIIPEAEEKTSETADV